MHENVMYAITSYPTLMSMSVENQAYLKSKIQENCCTTARRSLDGTKVIVKWRGEENPLTVLGVDHETYTYDEIIKELIKPEWDTDEI